MRKSLALCCAILFGGCNNETPPVTAKSAPAETAAASQIITPPVAAKSAFAEMGATSQIIQPDSVPQEQATPTSQPSLDKVDRPIANDLPAQGTENTETQLMVGVGDLFQPIESKERVLFAYSDSDIEDLSTSLFASDVAALSKLGEAKKIGSLDERFVLRVLEVQSKNDPRYSYVKCRVLADGQDVVAEAYVSRAFFTARFLSRLQTEIAKQPLPVTPSPSLVVKPPAKTALVPKTSVPTPNTRPKNEVIPVPSSGRVWVEGYTRKNGTHVKGYWRSK